MKITERRAEAKIGIKTGSKDGSITADHTFDPVAFDAAITKWRGFATERMLELGFKTTDEFVKAIRAR